MLMMEPDVVNGMAPFFLFKFVLLPVYNWFGWSHLSVALYVNRVVPMAMSGRKVMLSVVFCTG